MSNPLKRLGKAIGRGAKKVFNTTGIGGAAKLVGKGVEAVTGGRAARHAANEARTEAEQYANEAKAERATLTEKTKREKLRAQKLAVKGLRSRRAAAYFKPAKGTTGTYGSPTIG